MKEIERISIESIDEDPDLTPQTDSRLLKLIEQALGGELHVYFGAVPTGQIVPFDLDYRPDKHQIGAEAIESAFKGLKEGNFQKPGRLRCARLSCAGTFVRREEPRASLRDLARARQGRPASGRGGVSGEAQTQGQQGTAEQTRTIGITLLK